MHFLEIKELKKSLGSGEGKVEVLKGIDMFVERGEICAVLGASGSGKSTLLNVIGGLDRADGGSIIIDGADIAKMNDTKLSAYRREFLGFVFQFYNLVPNLTVEENIQLGEYLASKPLDMEEIIDVLGLNEVRNRFPSELSGGQQQRCSIGRALIKNPKLLLCDEPTGALDYKTSKDILSLAEKINREYKTTIVMVTHNREISRMCGKTVNIKDGTVYKTEINENIVPAAELEW
ncbi:MAG: ABC transporter ATP-binding protein [Ruminococcaceae bacterium]|nr:ABC transporter ATP-binding protein [Oscillospiraceae bacterium]